ncbi:MAG TPA: DNA-formamidopyrimidine glycosylase family protein [Polyangiaceae bacterium]|nr:DNA-formamidopyrimidine glycosylase family protein [Polyangiaceae bacterium]
MPELPEVETVCRTIRHALQGQRIARVEVVRDAIVFGSASPKTIEAALLGRTVKAVGRRGKFFWLCLSGEGPTVFGHLGMSGWIREVGLEGVRLHGHGDAPFDDEHGRPRFLKLGVAARSGRGIALTDPRRLGRVWLGPTPEEDRRVKRLGPDAFEALPPAKELLALFARRKIPIKAVLLDQSALAGIGNWIADEVLYQSRIAPHRVAASLTPVEVAALRRAIVSVLARAVKVGADHKKYPKSWLFEHRWGGSRGAQQIGGQRIVREEVGGRTTAWVPTRQK